MYVNNLNQRDMQRLGVEQSSLNNVAQEFNSYFISHLIKLAHEQEPDHIFGGGFAEKVFKDLLLNEYGTIIGQKLDIASSHIQKYVDNQNVEQNKHGVKQNNNMQITKNPEDFSSL